MNQNQKFQKKKRTHIKFGRILVGTRVLIFFFFVPFDSIVIIIITVIVVIKERLLLRIRGMYLSGNKIGRL